MRKARGSAGPDGWASEEIKYLPFNVAEIFAKLTKRWEDKGKSPKCQKVARQTNLEKPGKEKEMTFPFVLLICQPFSTANLAYLGW